MPYKLEAIAENCPNDTIFSKTIQSSRKRYFIPKTTIFCSNDEKLLKPHANQSDHIFFKDSKVNESQHAISLLQFGKLAYDNGDDEHAIARTFQYNFIVMRKIYKNAYFVLKACPS